MILDEEEYLAHYGTPRHSGRYPWGTSGWGSSSEQAYRDYVKGKRSKELLDYVKVLKVDGISEPMIAQGLGMTTLQLRAAQSISTNNEKQSNMGLAQRLKDKGASTTAISKRMNVPESTIRSWLVPGAIDKTNVLQNTVKVLKDNVDDKHFVDVGKGTEYFVPLGISRTKMDTALAMLQDEGYTVHLVKLPQASGHETTTKVLCPPGTTQREAFLNRFNIQQIANFSDDGGRTIGTLQEPLAINPKRISVVYKEDGGDKSDGMIYIRPGVDDLSIGGNKYAQVRVAVGKDHYLKGMAVYKEDLPDGVDIEFHTSKTKSDNKLDAMKKNSEEKGYIADGPHVLLKSVKRQILSNPGTPEERVTSAMNLVNEEGSWEEWSRNMSSQMLSKQRPSLAQAQLDMTFEQRKNELDAINTLTNSTVRKKMLNDFADSVDAAAVQLHAAILPGSAVHVILPISSIKQTEIYAPQYTDGTTVVLIRHPHAGPFEIPRLTVNNKNKEAKRLLGDSRDVVGINHIAAKQLSGADFDGDAVLVIPDNHTKIKSSNVLDGLKDFDPRHEYPGFPGMKRMSNTQNEIGKISNLITDMSLREAPPSELARAVRHSMVVIDAEKHFLNYKESERVNGIADLKKKYQVHGASTLISRSTAEDRTVLDRKPRIRSHGGPVDLTTGAKVFEPTGKTNRDGTPRKIKVEKLALTNDARTLMSTPIGTPMEQRYATHSNKMKKLAGQARLSAIKTPRLKTTASAKKTYEPEVKSLNAKLAVAERNAPLERQAQLIGGVTARARINDSENMDQATKDKITYQSLVQARIRTGAQKKRIQITQSEWDAIQGGAISSDKLTRILNNTDMETVRQYATPKDVKLMTPIKTNAALSMLASGYSRAYVAQHMGVSLSTLDRATIG